MTERIIVDVDNHVATVTLNRPAKKNAVDFAMFDGIRAAAQKLREDTTVRAVVLHGEGTDFCAGIDISVFAGEGIGATTAERLQPQTDYGANYYQDAALCWRELPVPVIAALNGTVFGAGLQIAMGADLRYAAADVRMSIMEIRWGIIPDMGITATMPGFLAEDRVRELAYTGRIVDADEALNVGLVTGIVDDPLASATAVAHEIAARNPDAVRATKQMISTAWRGDTASLLGLEARLQIEVMAGDNQKEAAAANIERRPPVFRDAKS